ncbi:MAG: DUF1430 domain-containing protein [Oscillospiraceae bacterium]|nr:DUF1430 domain-containing protein [Oscillospiraceae bacterium]
MKKIFYIIIIAYLCQLFALSIFDFSISLNEITAGKTTVEIEKPDNISNEIFIDYIENAAKSTKSDVIFSTVKQVGVSFVNVYYVTTNNDNFLHNISKEKYKLFLENSSLELDTLFNDIRYLKFNDIKALNLEKIVCHIKSENINEFFVALQNNDIGISQINRVSISERFVTILNQIYPFVFILFAAVFVMLSKRKETTIKRLNGYSVSDIIKNEFVSTVKVMLIIFSSMFVVTNIIHFVMFPNLFREFAIFMGIRLIIVAAAIIILFLLVSIIFLIPVKGVDLKGRSQNKQLFLASFAFKSIVIVATILYLTNAFVNLLTTHNLIKTQQFVTKSIETYVNVPWNISQVNIAESEWKNYYKRALEFYELTVDKFDGVIIDCDDYEGSNAEMLGYGWITTNHNYFDLDSISIYDINGTVFKSDYFSIKNSDIFSLLVPMSKKDKAEQIVQTYIAWYGEYGLTAELIDIIFYDDKKSIIYSFDSFIIENNGQLKNPVIEIFNKKYLAPQFGNYFGRGYMLNATNKELIPYLKEAHLENVIINTPLVSDDFTEHLSNLRFGLITTIINISINLIGMIALAIYIAKIYCESNRKKIAIMRMNGFKFFEIYKNYLLLQIIANVILIIFGTLAFNVNIIIFTVLAFIELFLFVAMAKYYETKNVLETIKEGD